MENEGQNFGPGDVQQGGFNQGYPSFEENQGYQENQINQGYQGYPSFQENQGYQENLINQGNQGYPGYQGYQGYQENQINLGNQENQLNQGFQGNQENQMNQGYQGNLGFQGNKEKQEYQEYQGYVINEGQNISICPYNNHTLCFDVEQGSKDDRARIILFDCNGQANQVWIRQGPCLVSKNSGKVMDIEGGDNEGKNLIQFTKTGGSNQQFKIVAHPYNPSLVYIAAPSGLVLTVKDNNITKRGEIIVSKYNGSDGQHWFIKKL